MNIAKIEATQLTKGPVTFEVNELPRRFNLGDESPFHFDSPITGEITATLAGTAVLLRGHLKTSVATDCVRCLESVRLPLRLEVTLTYMRDDRLLQPERYPELFEDDVNYFPGDVVEPIEDVRELLLLELPGFPSCELEEDDTCPFSGRKMGRISIKGGERPVTKEAPTSAKPEDAPGTNSWAAQWEKLRKTM